MTTERRTHLAWGLIQNWQPKYVNEMLGVEKTAWRFAMPVAKPFISAVDRVSRLLPHDDEAKAMKTIKLLGGAIELPDDQREQEVANPETLTADIAANKGRSRVAARRLPRSDIPFRQLHVSGPRRHLR